MKKSVYIAACILLGILIQFLIHAFIEIWYIGLLLADFEQYGLGLTWEQWVTIHGVGTVLLLLVGGIIGVWHGQYWWKRMYERS